MADRSELLQTLRGVRRSAVATRSSTTSAAGGVVVSSRGLTKASGAGIEQPTIPIHTAGTFPEHPSHLHPQTEAQQAAVMTPASTAVVSPQAAALGQASVITDDSTLLNISSSPFSKQDQQQMLDEYDDAIFSNHQQSFTAEASDDAGSLPAGSHIISPAHQSAAASAQAMPLIPTAPWLPQAAQTGWSQINTQQQPYLQQTSQLDVSQNQLPADTSSSLQHDRPGFSSSDEPDALQLALSALQDVMASQGISPDQQHSATATSAAEMPQWPPEPSTAQHSRTPEARQYQPVSQPWCPQQQLQRCLDALCHQQQWLGPHRQC